MSTDIGGSSNPRSTASIGGHPLHPMVIWQGWEMVYRHRVGIADRTSDGA